MKPLAKSTADYMAGQLGVSPDEAEVIGFGLEVMISFLLGAAAALVIAWGTGLLTGVMTCIAVAGTFRSFAGGAHCSSLSRCAVATAAVFPALALAASLVVPLAYWPLPVVVTVFALASVYFWAPADTPAKPLTTATHRARLRRLSYLFSAGLGILFFILSVVPSAEVWTIVFTAGSFGLAWQAFLITPWGYKTMSCLDRVLARALTK